MGSGPFHFLRSKVALALIGTCLIGGASAALAARITLSQQAALAESSLSQTSSNSSSSSSTSTLTSTATPSKSDSPTATAASGGNGGQNSPTATPVIFPTATARPQPTATPAVGQTCTITGSIRVINSGANTFTLRNSGVSHTIDVNSSTAFSGSASSFAALQVGWTATVTGVTQADGSCLASQVNSTSGGDS